MNLEEFLEAPDRNAWLDCSGGFSYYVRKSVFVKGGIELASCGGVGLGFARFWLKIKRYNLALMAENCLNPAVAAFYRRLGWREAGMNEAPSFYNAEYDRIYYERFGRYPGQHTGV